MSNDIYYSNKSIHKVIKVTPLKDYILDIEYEDGTKIEYDMKELLDHPLLRPLKDENVFKNLWISGSAICWEDDIDLCSDSIYELATLVN